MKKIKNILFVVVILLLIGVMLVSSILYLKDKKQDREELIVFEDLINIVDNQDTDNTSNIDNYSELFEMNTDMIGWIKIEDTNIDYPVMQTKNKPNYYLRRNFYKEYSYYGTPYMQENCDINKSDNLIIYGHHIKNNQMFGILEKYKSKDFYNDHRIIKFITKNEILEYEIIYIFKTSASNGFDYYKYIDFNDVSEFNTFTNKCKELAFYNTETESNFGDKYLTLSTCEYSIKNGRFVVITKKL